MHNSFFEWYFMHNCLDKNWAFCYRFNRPKKKKKHQTLYSRWWCVSSKSIRITKSILSGSNQYFEQYWCIWYVYWIQIWKYRSKFYSHLWPNRNSATTINSNTLLQYEHKTVSDGIVIINCLFFLLQLMIHQTNLFSSSIKNFDPFSVCNLCTWSQIIIFHFTSSLYFLREFSQMIFSFKYARQTKKHVKILAY